MTNLNSPFLYFPIDKPVYEVGPALKPFGTDLGAGDLDKKIFHFDEQFFKARQNKILAHNERISKYYLNNAPAEHIKTLAKFLIERLVMEWPEYFEFENSIFKSNLTNEELIFNDKYELLKNSKTEISYVDAIDGLVMQMQEDIAWVIKENDGSDALRILHVMSPSHWAPEVKFNQNFFNVHAPIPGVEKLNRSASLMVDAMIYKGPFLRLVWSFVTDQNFNHHPIAPEGIDQKLWKGRSFDLENKPHNPFDLRVERQITWGFKELGAALFTIRISFIEGQLVKKNSEWNRLLTGAIESMSEGALDYKGLSLCKHELLSWLKA